MPWPRATLSVAHAQGNAPAQAQPYGEPGKIALV